MHALQEMLGGVVDYAGLFPPAALPMEQALRDHAAHAASRERWMLGRFVVPSARLDELARADAALDVARRAPLRLAVLLGADLARELADLRRFDDAHRGRLHADAVELKAADADGVTRAARRLDEARHDPSRAFAGQAFVEVPLAADADALATAARAGGVGLKVRTGGVTADAFPAPAQVLRVAAACARLGVPWKATAGLHHALRGEHPLTYEPDAPRGTMLGFLPLLVADALLHAGAAPGDLLPLLEERDGATFAFDAGGVSWRGPRGTLRADATQIAAARRGGLASFGSCSFAEPVTELRALGLLQRLTAATQ